MTTFEIVKKLAQSRGITLKQLSENLDFGESTIYKWKQQTPKTEYLELVADYFNVSVDYLLGRETDNKSERDLDKMLDSAMSYDGEPMTDNDREVIRAFLAGKFAK